MSEWKLFTDEVAPVSTYDFHEHRERAPHLDQPIHRGRLELAADFIADAAERVRQSPTFDLYVAVSDLGCGDGGLLQLIRERGISNTAYGYDFQPSNAAGWAERGVEARFLDVFGGSGERILNHDVVLGDIVVMTEVLEHLTNPHEVLRQINFGSQSRSNQRDGSYVVASSPFTESDVSHDACHAWAWDQDGYRTMFQDAGFRIIRHEMTSMFQVILGHAE